MDYRANAPVDEWSGDGGCGVQYFSQWAVNRVSATGGHVNFAAGLPLPEKLSGPGEDARGRSRAARYMRPLAPIWATPSRTTRFYELKHILVLGRVTTGRGGDLILEQARRVLAVEFPQLAESLTFHVPDEKGKRHGQAIAAASLPAVKT